jgi:hypothetical protein
MNGRILALLVTLCMLACTKTHDAAGTASGSSGSTASTASPEISSVSSTQAPIPNHVAIPLYPNNVTKHGPVIDATSHGVHVVLVSTTTSDSIDTVAAWYKSHLSNGFTEIRNALPEGEEVEFVMGIRTAVPEHHVDIDPAPGGNTTQVVTSTHERVTP